MDLTFCHTSSKDCGHVRVMIVDFISQYLKNTEVDAIQAMRKMQAAWGITIDWHEFSNALDYMARNRDAHVSGFGRDGHTIYWIGYTSETE